MKIFDKLQRQVLKVWSPSLVDQKSSYYDCHRKVSENTFTTATLNNTSRTVTPAFPISSFIPSPSLHSSLPYPFLLLFSLLRRVTEHLASYNNMQNDQTKFTNSSQCCACDYVYLHGRLFVRASPHAHVIKGNASKASMPLPIPASGHDSGI